MNRILSLYAKNHVVLVSSRNISNAPDFCRLVLMVNGSIKAAGSVTSLVKAAEADSIKEVYRKTVNVEA